MIRLFTAAIAVCVFTSLTVAQTSPMLMIKPWVQNETVNPVVEASQDAIFMPSVEGDANYDRNISIYETAARWRLDNQAEHSVTLGFEQTIIDGGRSGRIDLRNRVDQSLAVGIPLGETDEGWKFAMTAGFGYAGNNAYGDGDAWYGLGSFIASKQLDQNTSLQLLLVYDGNRSIFPDVPLPAVSYNVRHDDQLFYSLGLPFSTVVWTPMENLTVRATYVIPFSVNASATYRLIEDLDVYVSYDRAMYTFHDNNRHNQQRVFFSHHRVEGGVKWWSCDYAEFIVAGGIAFAQEYETGYHALDLDNGADLDNAPYIRLSLDMRF